MDIKVIKQKNTILFAFLLISTIFRIAVDICCGVNPVNSIVGAFPSIVLMIIVGVIAYMKPVAGMYCYCILTSVSAFVGESAAHAWVNIFLPIYSMVMCATYMSMKPIVINSVANLVSLIYLMTAKGEAFGITSKADIAVAILIVLLIFMIHIFNMLFDSKNLEKVHEALDAADQGKSALSQVIDHIRQTVSSTKDYSMKINESLVKSSKAMITITESIKEVSSLSEKEAGEVTKHTALLDHNIDKLKEATNIPKIH